MKKTFNIIILSILCSIISNAQTKKITISDDAFVQGGETANETLGETKSKNLLIFNSKENTKYARITYLKFPLPKIMTEGTTIELNIAIKVYKNEANPDLNFNLEVVGVKNDNWSESTITWNNKPELGVVLGATEIKQSVNNELQLVKVKLDAQEFKKLYENDREVTIALVNNNFNKISAMGQSKESYAKNAAYLQID
jgi:hypothetical protein